LWSYAIHTEPTAAPVDTFSPLPSRERGRGQWH
jgi:hypothetical protein